MIQLVYPRRCPVCDRIVYPFGEKICSSCIDGFKLISPPWCIRCGKKLMEESTLCSDCENAEHIFTRGRSLYEYASSAMSIYRFKYGGRREYAEYYGEQIAEYLGDFIRKVNPDALVPIPLYKGKLNKRGYNQAEELAKAITKYTGVPTERGLLKRVKNTTAMKMLSRGERRANLKNAFIISRNSVKLRTIIIIDDIYTTGTTLDEAARVFKDAGVDNIFFITLAGGSSV